MPYQQVYDLESYGFLHGSITQRHETGNGFAIIVTFTSGLRIMSAGFHRYLDRFKFSRILYYVRQALTTVPQFITVKQNVRLLHRLGHQRSASKSLPCVHLSCLVEKTLIYLYVLIQHHPNQPISTTSQKARQTIQPSYTADNTRFFVLIFDAKKNTMSHASIRTLSDRVYLKSPIGLADVAPLHMDDPSSGVRGNLQIPRISLHCTSEPVKQYSRETEKFFVSASRSVDDSLTLTPYSKS